MSKFKVGDRVVYRGKDSNNPYNGRTGVVIDLGFEDNINRVEFDDGGEKWWCSSFEIELDEKVDKISNVQGGIGMSKFKFEDRVRYVGSVSGTYKDQLCDVLILDYLGYDYAVRFDDGGLLFTNECDVEEIDKISDTQVADEMFAALGYVKELNKPSYDILYKHRLGNILFKNDDNIVEFFNFGGYDDSITTEDHLAIHQKLKELGWIQ